MLYYCCLSVIWMDVILLLLLLCIYVILLLFVIDKNRSYIIFAGHWYALMLYYWIHAVKYRCLTMFFASLVKVCRIISNLNIMSNKVWKTPFNVSETDDCSLPNGCWKWMKHTKNYPKHKKQDTRKTITRRSMLFELCTQFHYVYIYDTCVVK